MGASAGFDTVIQDMRLSTFLGLEQVLESEHLSREGDGSWLAASLCRRAMGGCTCQSISDLSVLAAEELLLCMSFSCDIRDAPSFHSGIELALFFGR